jgi:ferredoxin-NADP reductase
MSATSIVVTSLEVIFPVAAAANVWTALQGSRPSRDPASRTRLLLFHRLGGYLFLFLFSVIFLYMNLRVAGVKEELPPSIVVHSLLAFLLVPLLLLKTVIARYHKNHSGAILGLGLAIFSISFVLVAVTAVPRLWAAVPLHVSPGVSLSVIALLAVLFGALFARRPLRPASVAGSKVDIDGGLKASSGPAPPKAPRKSLILLLSQIEDQTHDAKTLRFILRPGETFASRPGQFLTFNWIVDGQTLPRCYSICSSPSRTGHLEITVKRTANGRVSTFLNQRARVGLAVEARGPSGQFCFEESQHRRIVLIAGGSGITPMMAMLRYIDELKLATDVTLIYFVKTPEDIIFASELQRLKGSMQNFRYSVVVSQPDPSWQGSRGHLSRELIAGNAGDLHACTFFFCGPPGMMESGRNLLQSLGISAARIRQESFGGAAGPASLPSVDLAQGSVEFARSGKFSEPAQGQTLLEAAEVQGISIPWSCRQGQCGTCAVRLLGGCVRMDSEDGLTPELKKGGYVLACVARPDGDVRLDL